MASDRLLIFVKRPEAGRVKTRLTPPLPPDEAAQVYEACLRDVVALAARERGRVELWYEGGVGAAEYFDREYAHLPRFAQAPGTLGEKLHNAFAFSFGDAAERVVVIGSDMPTIPENVLSAAFDDLREVDAVLAPTNDGGYYLIGVRAAAWPAAEALFREIPWSTEAVARVTLERAEQAALTLRVLPGWYDIDRIEDLRRAERDAAPDSHLARWLSSPEARHYIGAE